MGNNYQHLPGVNLELLDGNLRIDESITGPAVLIIGTAFSGKSNFQYVVRDSNVAAAAFGADSPLVQKMSEVKMGGAKNVILYRVGGKAAELQNLFGADSALYTVEETVAAGSKFSLYVGPRPTDPAKACVIVFEGSRIVFSNVPGAEVDLAKIKLVGFNENTLVRIGTPTAPVLLETALANTVEAGTVAATGDGTKTEFDLTGVLNADAVTLFGVTVDGVPVSGTVSNGTTLKKVTLAVAPAAGKAVVISIGKPQVVAGATYTAGEDNIGANWQKYYELVDRALLDLETTLATAIYIDRAIADAPNVATGSVDADKLSYLSKTEEYGEVKYEWSTTKLLYKKGVGTTAVIGEADVNSNGQPVIAKRFYEVNFAHQLATWAHTISENERSVLAVVGTSLPALLTTAGISKWIGTLPQLDIEGKLVVNGTGLLGNKFMTGSTTSQSGFFVTDSGFVDGNTLFDDNGAPIDAGKYLSVVPQVIVTPTSASLGSVAKVTNAAAVYTGLLSTITPGNSTTNVVVPRVALPFTVKKVKLDELSGAGYVTFQEKSKGVTVVSGELATNPNSDFDYVSTIIIVNALISRVRERLDPFIGKGTSDITVAAINTAVENIFQAAVQEGSVVKYAFNVLVDPVKNGAGRIRIPFTIVPPFELREVNVSMKLAYEI